MPEQLHVFLRPVATPLPVTFAGLAIASVVASGYEGGAVPVSQARAFGWGLLAIPVLLQLLAAALGFVSRSATAATASSVLAAGWLAVALERVGTDWRGRAPGQELGLLLLAAGAALFVPASAALIAGTLLPALVVAAAGGHFLVTGVAGISQSPGWTVAAADYGYALAGLALYGALALELEAAAGRALLPTLRVGAARRALEEPPKAQLDEIEHEPGVRGTL